MLLVPAAAFDQVLTCKVIVVAQLMPLRIRTHRKLDIFWVPSVGGARSTPGHFNLRLLDFSSALLDLMRDWLKRIAYSLHSVSGFYV